MKVIEPHLPVFKIKTFIFIWLGNTNIRANLHPDITRKQCLTLVYLRSDVINLTCFVARTNVSKISLSPHIQGNYRMENICSPLFSIIFPVVLSGCHTAPQISELNESTTSEGPAPASPHIPSGVSSRNQKRETSSLTPHTK